MSRHLKFLRNYSWEVITHYMNPEIAEKVHAELAPCTNEEFLKRYLELHPEFWIN